MNGAIRAINAVYWLALTVWVAGLVTAGIAAMNTFSRLPKMQIELRDYSALPAGEQGRLAAGMVMEGVFATVDWMQIVATPLSVLTLIFILAFTKPSWRSIPNLLRCVCIIVAAGLFTFHIVALSSTMNQHLHGYWDELRAGRLAEARMHLEAFDRFHPIASGVLKTNLVLLLAGIAASAMMPMSFSEGQRRVSIAPGKPS